MDPKTPLTQTTESEFESIISRLGAIKLKALTEDCQLSTDITGQPDNELSPSSKGSSQWVKFRRLHVESKYRRAKKLLGGQISRSVYLTELLARERRKNKELMQLLRRSMNQMNQQLTLIKDKFKCAKIELRRLSSVLYLTEKEKERAVYEVHSLQDTLNEVKKREVEVEDQMSLPRLQDGISCGDSAQSCEDASNESSSQASATPDMSANLEPSWNVEVLQNGCQILQDLVNVIYEQTNKEKKDNKTTQTEPSVHEKNVQATPDTIPNAGSSESTSIGTQVECVEVVGPSGRTKGASWKDLLHYKALCVKLEEVVKRLDDELEQERNEVVSLCAANFNLQQKLNFQQRPPTPPISTNDQNHSIQDKWELPSSVGSLETKSSISNYNAKSEIKQ